MEKYEYIESGIIFGLSSLDRLKAFPYSSGDFAHHGDAYKFLIDYIDKYNQFPTSDLLASNFNTLDLSASTVDFDYCKERFIDQKLRRDIVKLINSNKSTIEDKPKQAYTKLLDGLYNINSLIDEDVSFYESDSSDRFSSYQTRKEKRLQGGGLLGIATPFDTLNNVGAGFMPGELVGLFARPSIGKTWLCAEVTANAFMQGYKTLLVSTEMPVESINLRLDAIMARKMGFDFTHRSLRNGETIDEDQYQVFLESVKEKKSQLMICDHITGQSSISLEAIAGIIRKHKPEIVIIDGIYLIELNNTSKSSLWETSQHMCASLKALCMSQNIPMFVSTQANRDASDIYKPPGASSVAFGDALLRSGDMIFSMCGVLDQNDEPEEQIRRIQVQKMRDHALFVNDLYLHWDVNRGDIHEVEYDRFSSY